MRSRTRIHTIFWTIYFLWDVYAQVISLSTSNKTFHFWPQFTETGTVVLLTLLPKVLLAYFILAFPLKRAFLAQKISWGNGLLICASVLAGVLLYRMIAYFIVFPYLFETDMSMIFFFSQPGLSAALLDILIPVSMLVSFELYRTSRVAQERQSKLEKEKLQSELNFLKAQTNPHFLFNTLSNIYGLAKNQAPKAADAVLRLSKLLRFMLYESESKTITIREEIKFLEDYIELQKIRFDERLTIKLETEIDNDNAKIAALILLPFVENAFKHGAGESVSTTFISIYIRVNDNQMEFDIENSTEKNETPPKPNIGLSNVIRQLELIYPTHELTIENPGHFFKVRIKLNLGEYEKNDLYSNRR
ncbi:MAG: histidine kinase [Ferruginibacter sp.]|nr:histidine kinase [Chitinophagaceae bacterium]